MPLLLVLLTNNYWQVIAVKAATLLPIKYIRIKGQFQYLQQQQLEQILRPFVQSNFMSVNLQVIQETATSLPWVDKAEVKRVWPDTIAIQIYEQQAAARWHEKGLLNSRGDLFVPSNIERFELLPNLNGGPGMQRELFEIMTEITQLLSTSGLGLAEFTVSEQQSWQIKLLNGINIKLGRNKPLQKFKQFLKVMPIMGYDKLALIKTVDMRYPNGFSIAWKAGVPINWGQNNLILPVPS